MVRKTELYEVNFKGKAKDREIAACFLKGLFEEAIKNVLPKKVEEILDQLEGKLFTEEDNFICKFEISVNGLGLLAGFGMAKRKKEWRKK